MSIDRILYEKFGHQSFRQGQKEIIEDVLQGYDVFAMLPTGTGKSICYQLPAYLLEGVVLVVSPLISLMEDQVEQLRRNGEKRVCTIHSGLPYPERKRILRNLQHFKIIYVSPETLQADYLTEALTNITVSLLVVDEAHCISQWGHEFRTDYLKLREVCLRMGRPPVLALTATATEQVREDILRQLAMIDPRQHLYSVDRPNIAFHTEIAENPLDKMDTLVKYVRSLQGPGIIYTSSRMMAETITETLKRNGIKKAAYYHGGMENDDRLLIQKQFIYDELDVICCTNAFGMGINKPNIRFVMHFHFPSNMESYLQEIGRAGRDGEQSLAIILYHEDDDFIPERLIASELPTEQDLNKLVRIVSGKSEIRSAFSDAMNQLDLSETAERFLEYHIGNLMENPAITLSQWKDELTDLIEERIKEKRARIRYMKKWIQSDYCKRESILHQFSEQMRSKPEYCCHVCGLSLEPFEKGMDEPLQTDERSWREELAVIFNQEIGHV